MVNGNDGMERAVAARQTQVGGDWFFWIAALSSLNTIFWLFHVPFGFFFGLGLPEIVLRSGFGIPIWIGVTVIAALIFVLCGYFARRGALSAFIVGMLLYVADALLCFLNKDYLGGGVHAYALFRIFQGFQGAQRFSQLSASPPFSAIGTGPQASSDVWPPPPSA